MTNEIEKLFVEHVSHILCESEEVKSKFEHKYEGIKDIMVLNKDNIADINRLFR